MAKKNASPPSKRRKVLVLNEEDVDNILVESMKSFSMRPAIPLKVKITYPDDIACEESDDESEPLSPELGFVAIKPSAKASITLTSKGSIQTESIPILER